MKCQKQRVKIVIPVYTERLDERAAKSLRQTIKVLGQYPITLLVPEDLNTTELQREYSIHDFTSVRSDWLGSRGIEGYNEMMLSRDFYELFADYDYILICQTDAWIFRDELARWCDAGYDYVGAPWPKRKFYSRAIVRHWLAIRRALFMNDKRILRQQGFNKVGNGGLSLRRIEAFITACDRHADVIEIFKRKRGMLYNEDWFWSIIPQELHYPSLEEALGFSFDIRPQLCYDLSGGKLPFGCHGWYKKRNIAFWQPIIEGQKGRPT